MITMAKTFDQAIYEHTATDIIRDLAKDLMQSKPSNNLYSSVFGIDKAVEEIDFKNSIKKLYNKYHGKHTTGKSAVQGQMRRNMDIIKIGNFDMSIDESVAMAKDIMDNAGDDFYGMLLSCNANVKLNIKKTTFNPLHPIIATELASESSPIPRDAKIWTMTVFAWKDIKKIVKSYGDMMDTINDENYVPEIIDMLSTLIGGSEYIIKNSNVKASISNNKFVINYDEKRISKETGEEVSGASGGHHRNWIVPCQILNNSGIAFPYYGTVYSKNGIAWNITPAMSANVSKPVNGNAKFDNGSRICTKSGDSKTVRGIAALNHSNLTSALNSACWGHGSLTYSQQAMKAAMEIITGEPIVTAEKKVKKPMTFKEYTDMNKGKTAKDYLEYMKDFVAHAEVVPEDQVKNQQQTSIMDRTDPIDLTAIEVAQDQQTLDALAETA